MPLNCRVTCAGYVDQRPLSEVELEVLARDIVAGTVGRPEIVVDLHDDSTDGSMGSMVLGPLHPAGDEALKDRWCLEFAEPDADGRWCLSSPGGSETYHWYVLFGGETEVMERCAVPLTDVLTAVRRCCSHGGRDVTLPWVDAVKAMNL